MNYKRVTVASYTQFRLFRSAFFLRNFRWDAIGAFSAINYLGRNSVVFRKTLELRPKMANSEIVKSKGFSDLKNSACLDFLSFRSLIGSDFRISKISDFEKILFGQSKDQNVPGNFCVFFRRKTKSHPALDLRYYPPLTISFLALVDFPVPRHGGLALPGSSGGAISPLL